VLAVVVLTSPLASLSPCFYALIPIVVCHRLLSSSRTRSCLLSSSCTRSCLLLLMFSWLVAGLNIVSI
jgi:hypothetical protein